MVPLTLNDIAKFRAALDSEKSEYEEANAMAEFNYNLKCFRKAEQLIKAGKTVTEDELWDLA